MKRIFASVSILLLMGAFFVQPLVRADSDKNVDEVLGEIMSEQDVSSIGEIDCDEVSNEQFAEVGDAVMGVMHPDEEEHSLMDNMMGGEGSESLESMHITMGRRYLGCWSGGDYNLDSFNMGMGHMMPFWNGSGSIDSLWNTSSNWGIFWVILIGFIFVGSCILLLIWIMVRKGNGESAVKILEQRYAKGEISEKEFTKMKKELTDK